MQEHDLYHLCDISIPVQDSYSIWDVRQLLLQLSFKIHSENLDHKLENFKGILKKHGLE